MRACVRVRACVYVVCVLRIDFANTNIVLGVMHLSFMCVLYPGDSLEYHNNQPFSTYDRDNIKRCASRRQGGWWYLKCLNSNLNGLYGNKISLKYMVWQHWKGISGLHMTTMKVRPARKREYDIYVSCRR